MLLDLSKVWLPKLVPDMIDTFLDGNFRDQKIVLQSNRWYQQNATLKGFSKMHWNIVQLEKWGTKLPVKLEVIYVRDKFGLSHLSYAMTFKQSTILP